jgi:hypothetical protein
MLMTQTKVQGMSGDALRVQALQVVGTLSEDQLLIVVSYARALLGETLAPRHHAPAHQHHPLEELVEEPV